MQGGSIDDSVAAEFAERMLTLLADGSLALLCSIGEQTGLFDALAEVPDATTTELAHRAGLNERYVREWLGGLTCGAIVEYDPETARYRLPREHAASLTHAAGPDNLANILRFLPLLAEVEQPVIECFREGGGVPYSTYTRFHQIMASNSTATFDAALIDVMLPLVDGIDAQLESGIAVADIGCGSGHAVNLMARAYPASTFIGYDFEQSAIEAACAEATEWELANAEFDVLDVADLDEPRRFGLITAFDAIHDQADPARVLERIYHALEPAGAFFMVDIKADSRLERNLDNPFAPFLFTASLMHCMTVSLALHGAGLGTVWGRQRAIGMLDDAGFTEIEVREIVNDPINNYYVARRGTEEA